ncbi:polysaccharide deacetylase family protein [Luteococcus peritonei]|uniref:Polysaccharide deacetylase family protein n=1 Tax=Luteococcus peritonei TaxID=88874 RepID=A0ABW4S087_9ACTN
MDCRKLKCIALTYDDGPGEHTPELLKAFTSRHASATLFMLGNAAKAHPEIVRQAAAQGFEVANHTYDHKPISDLSDAQVADEVKRTDDVLQQITGRRPHLMRPPYAARTSRTDKVVGAEGLSVIVWDNSPEDWVAGHDTAPVISKLTLQRASRNSIILMHDIHPWTVKAAPAIIDGLQKQGYTLVTVSQLLGSTKAGTVYPRH